MFNFSFLHPGLLWGGLAVGIPILIHLLSRRRYKLIQWAAMEYLLAANKINRRRIQLEQLILLLLRCLAILLATLLIARLVIKSGMGGHLIGQPRIEHTVILDDSPSMTAMIGTRSAFDEAREDLVNAVRNLARSRRGDTLTLLLTSRPQEPRIHGQYLSDDNEDLLAMLESLTPSDAKAAYADCLRFLLDEHDRGVPRNRQVYLVTDLRVTDWKALSDEDSEANLLNLARKLKETGAAVTVVDAGVSVPQNAGVLAVEPSEPSVAVDVPIRYRVVLRNFSNTDMDDVGVTFTAGTAPPQQTELARLGPGEEATATFTFTAREDGPLPITVELSPDDLIADNTYHYATFATAGMKILIVDDSYVSPETMSDSYFLRLALSPPGDSASGNVVEVVTDNEFQGLDLAPYQAIFVCNPYRFTEERLKTLRAWVENGGGLTLFLGAQADPDLFNETVCRDGKGLSPLRLDTLRGDADKRVWANMVLSAANHPAVQIYAGANNPFLQRVKFFRWWHTAMPETLKASGEGLVIAHLTNPEQSPLAAERRLGEGRVIVLTSSPDTAWNNWPSDASYVVTCLELARYAGRPLAGERQLDIGAALSLPVDPARHQLDVRVQPPAPRSAATVRAAPSGSDMLAEYRETDHAGFYEVTLTSHEQKPPEVRLFAVNPPADEGDARRLDLDDFENRLRKDDIELVRKLGAGSATAETVKQEFWRVILALLFLALCAEQVLAWLFGMRR